MTTEDLRRLSRVFCAASDLRTDQDVRINAWLMAMIARSQQPNTEHLGPSGKPIDGYPLQQA